MFDVRLRRCAARSLFILLFAAIAAPAQDVLVDVVVNGDFESWSYSGAVPTRLEPPDGWQNVDGAASTDYIDPTLAPIGGARSLITTGDGGTRGQLTLQDGLSIGPRWRFRADFAYEDPQAGVQDEIATSFQIPHPNSGSGDAGRIILWIKDKAPDDGVAELWLRNNAGAQVNAGNIPGLTFSADVTTSGGTVVHELVIDGHYDDPSPSFDVTFNVHGGASVAFPGLQIWQAADPATGNAPNGLLLFGDTFSVARGKWDNVRMGSRVPGITLTEQQLAGVTRLPIDTFEGVTYLLEYTTDPVGGTWIDAGARMVGDGAVRSFYHPAGTVPARAYRVLTQ